MDEMLVFENAWFKMYCKPEDGTALMRPVGFINEDVNFGAIIQEVVELLRLAPDADGKNCVNFDLSGVDRINSCGVREWLLFLQKLQTSMRIRFGHVNELFVEQANMIPDILGAKGTGVDCVEVPYYCEACDCRVSRYLPIDEIRSVRESGVPPVPCEKCGGQTELDALEDEYFRFLSRH